MATGISPTIPVGSTAVDPAATDPADDLTGLEEGPAVSRSGDVWELGWHRLICGDALRDTSYQALLQGELAQMVVSDPPYNVPIKELARKAVKASSDISPTAIVNSRWRVLPRPTA